MNAKKITRNGLWRRECSEKISKKNREKIIPWQNEEDINPI